MSQMKPIHAVTLLGAVSLLLAVAAGPALAQQDIVATARSAGQFKTLLAAAKAAGLVDALQGEGPLTVFAPSDKAFAKLPDGTVESLLKPENRAKLVAILKYHVVPGRLPARDVAAADTLQTLNGANLTVSKQGGTVMIDEAAVIKANVDASNGIIHVIDAVMLPRNIVQVAANDKQFSTLVAAVKTAGLVDALSGDGPFTLFAPTNEAFDKLPDGTVEMLLKPENRSLLQTILKYHVVPGKVFLKNRPLKTAQGSALSVVESGTTVVNNAEVLASDIVAANGVIHVIDTVLIPGGDLPTPAREARQLIELAIDRGVPLFNNGQPAACAAIYEIAATSLLTNHADVLADRDEQTLRSALTRIQSAHNDRRKAWILRHALDDVYLSLRRK